GGRRLVGVAALHGSGMVLGIGDRGRYLRRVVGRGGPGRRRCRNSSLLQPKKGPTASCCESATRTVRLGGHVQSGTRRVAQRIRGNHSLRKQNSHQRTSYWLD